VIYSQHVNKDIENLMYERETRLPGNLQTDFPLCHLVQDNLLDPDVTKIQNAMKAD